MAEWTWGFLTQPEKPSFWCDRLSATTNADQTLLFLCKCLQNGPHVPNCWCMAQISHLVGTLNKILNDRWLLSFLVKYFIRQLFLLLTLLCFSYLNLEVCVSIRRKKWSQVFRKSMTTVNDKRLASVFTTSAVAKTCLLVVFIIPQRHFLWKGLFVWL